MRHHATTGSPRHGLARLASVWLCYHVTVGGVNAVKLDSIMTNILFCFPCVASVGRSASEPALTVAANAALRRLKVLTLGVASSGRTRWGYGVCLAQKWLSC